MRAHLQSATATLEPAHASTGVLSVLIADKDRSFARALRDILRDQGYTVALAGGLDDLPGDMARHGANLLLLALPAEHAAGQALLRQVKGRLPGAQCIAMVPGPGQPAALELLAHGAADVISKPVHPPALLAMLRRSAEHVLLLRECSAALAALRESEVRFDAIAEATPGPLFIALVEDGALVYANSAFGATFRLTSCFRTLSAGQLFADAAQHGRIGRALQRRSPLLRYARRMRRADGETFWAVLYSRALDIDSRRAALTSLVETPHSDAP